MPYFFRYARSVSDYTISRENYERLRQAAQTRGAISPMDLASAKAKTDADSALRDGKTVKIDVTTGNESDNRIEILGEVRAGEEVVANATDETKEGITIP